MGKRELKNLCWYCKFESSGFHPCEIMSKFDEGMQVQECIRFQPSFAADVAFDAINAIQVLIKQKKLTHGSVCMHPRGVITVTHPVIPETEFINEMVRQAVLRKENEVKSALQMYAEIMEVSDELRLTDWEMEFLEDIESRVEDDDLTDKQLEVLQRIYKKACDSPY